jgi:hypothetical protein
VFFFLTWDAKFLNTSLRILSLRNVDHQLGSRLLIDHFRFIGYLLGSTYDRDWWSYGSLQFFSRRIRTWRCNDHALTIVILTLQLKAVYTSHLLRVWPYWVMPHLIDDGVSGGNIKMCSPFLLDFKYNAINSCVHTYHRLRYFLFQTIRTSNTNSDYFLTWNGWWFFSLYLISPRVTTIS